jgi:hypothetical protein
MWHTLERRGMCTRDLKLTKLEPYALGVITVGAKIHNLSLMDYIIHPNILCSASNMFASKTIL